jgi:hypothetical protein
MQTLWPGLSDLNRWAQIKLYATSNEAADNAVKDLIRKLADNERVSDGVQEISKKFGLPDLDLIIDGTVKLYDCLDREQLIQYYQELIFLCVDNCA